MMTLLAFLFVNPEHVTALLMNFLAVGGGFMAGYLLMVLVVYLIGLWVPFTKNQDWLKKPLYYIGGVVGAIIVALIVFGAGNGGTTDGPGKGDGTTEKTGNSSGTPTGSTEQQPVTPPTTPEPKGPEETLKITILSGTDVKDEKFYLIEKDRTAKTLDEVKDAIKSRNATTTKPLAIDIQLAPRTDRNNSGVLDLESWARDAGMRVILPKKE